MQVETFECQETIAEPLECTEEALKLIEDCGLEGQKKLVVRRDDKPASRCPYRQIKADEQWVYRRLCSETVSLNDYEAGPIPLRVLQIIAHAKSLDFFKRFDVWCAPGAVKDPVLVAYCTESTHRETPYILARWGEELDEWAILVKMALTKFKETALAKLQEISVQVMADIKKVESEALSLDKAIDRDAPSYYSW